MIQAQDVAAVASDGDAPSLLRQGLHIQVLCLGGLGFLSSHSGHKTDIVPVLECDLLADV